MNRTSIMANIGESATAVGVSRNSSTELPTGLELPEKVLRFIIRLERFGKYKLFCKFQFEQLENIF